MLRLQGNFTTQFLSVSMGFAQREGHLREKFFLTAYLAQLKYYNIAIVGHSKYGNV